MFTRYIYSIHFDLGYLFGALVRYFCSVCPLGVFARCVPSVRFLVVLARGARSVWLLNIIFSA